MTYADRAEADVEVAANYTQSSLKESICDNTCGGDDVRFCLCINVDGYIDDICSKIKRVFVE